MIFKPKPVVADADHYNTPFDLAWRRMKKNRPSVLGLLMIAMAVLLAFFSYLIVPDSTPDANNIIPEIALQPPGFTQQFLLIRKDDIPAKRNFFQKMLYGDELPYSMLPISGSIEKTNDSILVNYYRGEGMKPQSMKISAGKLSSVDGSELNSTKAASFTTTKKYLLGTDTYGRDILSRLVIGIRISLAVGGMAVFISLLIGIFLGAIAGYFRGSIDDLVMWLINVIWAIPTLLLVFAITIVLGKGFWQIFVAVGLTMWVQVARVVRGQVMSIRTMEYIEAAQSLGYRHSRIIFQHILPNTLGPVMVIAASNFAAAILIEAGLSFLGIGVQPPAPSWGSMIRENYGFIISSNPLLALAPGIAIMILVLAFNMTGNGLRDALDIKTRIE